MTAAQEAGPAGSGILQLRLYNFRNYGELEVRLGPALNLFTGENAQGKSNLLEAVATLLLTRSPRAVSAAELLRWGTDEAAVDALVSQGSHTETLGLRLRRQVVPGSGPAAARAGQARVTRSSLADGKPIPARKVLGRCPVVLFWPDDLQLVKAGPEARRRLVDTLLSQLDPQAGDDLVRYRRVVEQRNALLRQLHRGAEDHALQPFDEALVLHGARVQQARAGLVAGLAPLARTAMEELTGGREELVIRYRPDSSGPEGGEGDRALALREALARSRSDELSRGLTLVGPHRDDVEYVVDGRAARATASQGQQRSAVLATKLAELRYARARSGRDPLLLLDDVLSELDAQRGGQLLDALTAGDQPPQTLITSTEHPDLGSRAARRFEVRRGTVSEG